MFHTKFIGMFFICIHNKFCPPGSDVSLSPSILKERYRFCIVPFFPPLYKNLTHISYLYNNIAAQKFEDPILLWLQKLHVPQWGDTVLTGFSWFSQFSRQKQKWYLKEVGCYFLLHPLNPLLINSPITSHNTIWVVESFIK